jgi:hypothetical protein
MRVAVVLALLVLACGSPEPTPAARAGRSAATVEAKDGPLGLDSATAFVARYLEMMAERDTFPVALRDSRRMDGPCVEEMYGDEIASYWLGRGRLLGFETQVVDTLPARVELLTVAEQVPTGESMYGSEVRARLKTDTLVLRLVPDSTRRRWQVCGFLSDGFDFGGYGKPENVRYRPPGVTRGALLRQVDSIRRASRAK